jgi:hydroxyacylglutathione hydrolase
VCNPSSGRTEVFLERIVSEGIAPDSYLIGSAGIAAVIDPRRDCEIYLDIAGRNELVISHIFETHRNEDYIIGSKELADCCGAAIYHGANLDFSYGKPVVQGETFILGSLELTILETPGHTEESISIIVRDREVSDKPYLVFCGDTLFSGDIARTDFYGKLRNEEMAKKIYLSIVNKLLILGDGVIVCPAHGAGSVCGEQIADHPLTSIGYEKLTNPQLTLDQETFVTRRVNEKPYFPPYFRHMEKCNKNGPPLLHRLKHVKPLTIKEVNNFRKSGCQIVDIRSPTSFGAGHVPGSLSIWREGLSAFMGWFLDYQRPVILVDDFNLDLDLVSRHFLRLGYDSLEGVLSGGFIRWIKAAQEIDTVPTCSVQQLEELLSREKPFILDVRDIKNWRTAGHIPGAHHIYVGELPRNLDKLPKKEPMVVYCDAGYKGSLAASFLKIHGYHSVTNVLGGMTAWNKAGFPVEK